MSFKIFVTPNARKFEVKVENGEILVKTKSPAEDNKANFEVLKEFKRIFKKPIFLLRGAKSREKELEIEGVPFEDVLNFFNARK